MLQLVIHFIWLHDRDRRFLPEQRAKALAQSADRRLHHRDRNAQAWRDFGQRFRFPSGNFAREEAFQIFE